MIQRNQLQLQNGLGRGVLRRRGFARVERPLALTPEFATFDLGAANGGAQMAMPITYADVASSEASRPTSAVLDWVVASRGYCGAAV